METTKTKEELEREKQHVAEAAARWVPDGVRLGLGSGTTAAYFIKRVGQRIRDEGLRVVGLPTSSKSRELAGDAGIPLIEPSRGLRLDLTVDGADEIDPSLALIKGGGGALLREKVIASISRYLVIIADSSKPVPVLGHFPLPLEVVPFATHPVMDRIEDLGGTPVLRRDTQTPDEYARTDQGNWLLDCKFSEIPDPDTLAKKLAVIPGIVEHGLFLGLARAAVVADGDRVLLLRPGQPPVSAKDFSSLP